MNGWRFRYCLRGLISSVTETPALSLLCVKPRTHDQITHRFRPRFALLPVVGTGRFDVARWFVRASVVFGVVAVNSSDIKGPDGASLSAH
ncbi:hypothetical protein AVEN_215638-1 [Araneus ventricosus]|uniref:Uncharacterized protein n=1 Tax=Araneus ventricosus TaxID=182803 RepID=A0A4Y2KDR3_ARAVE|nr:hypothetical protein AVEN_215638-1 [Araneus ventricosus]